MTTIVLELDDDLLDKVMEALKDIPQDKIKISKLIKQGNKDIYEELSKIKNPWEMLRVMSGTIEGEPDESVEHDHYIRSSPKINENELQ